MTVEQALAWARTVLVDVSEPLDAQSLLMHVLKLDRATIMAHPEKQLTPEQAAAYETLIRQRAAGVPVPYLTGTRAFYDRDLVVSPAVLIPRPETEHVIDAALDWARNRSGVRLVDVGTGSGAIAITLAAHLSDAQVWAIDISPDALNVARHNAARYSLQDRITFIQGDLLAPLLEQHQPADLIAANLPYIASEELTTLAVAQYEPHLALDGGPDGLELIRRLLNQAPGVLVPGGMILLEIGAGQGEQVRRMAETAFPGASIRVLNDYAGFDRVVAVETR